jgi:peptidoglycan hydrolase-like protein with peptidoglycan-binding domain
MYKKILTTGAVIVMVVSQVSAFQSKITAQYFNGPTVTNITETSATFSLSDKVLKDISSDELAGVYFELSEPEKICIMVYPTPESCLPKKFARGSTTVTVTGLTPNTKYSIVYKHDNTIRCITAPCPGNEYESLSVTFVTKGATSDLPGVGNGVNVKRVTRALSYRSSGEEVKLLQGVLITRGFMSGAPTGYFGMVTMKALKDFQKSYNLTPTGAVGPRTKKVLNDILLKEVGTSSFGETFSGKIDSVSTGCFADGECAIVVAGKKIVTMTGMRLGQPLPIGTIKGVASIGDAEQCIGKHATVYAKKLDDGYTLYGDTSYYVSILDCKVSIISQ